MQDMRNKCLTVKKTKTRYSVFENHAWKQQNFFQFNYRSKGIVCMTETEFAYLRTVLFLHKVPNGIYSSTVSFHVKKKSSKSFRSILSLFLQCLVKEWGHLQRTTAMKNSVMQTIHCETIVNLGGILLFAKVKIDEQKTMSCVFFKKSFVFPIFSFFYNDDIGGSLRGNYE